MSIKNDILKNALLLESGDEDDEVKMYEKNGIDDIRQGYLKRDWKVVNRALQFIKDPNNRKLIKKGIKEQDWNHIRKVYTNLGC